MTTYSIVRKTNEALIEISGHAEYSHEGDDIVCAAISTACILTANIIDNIGLRYNILDLVMNEGYYRLQVKVDSNVMEGIVKSFEEMLNDLERQYPKNIKMKK